jgi:hypothetical protein
MKQTRAMHSCSHHELYVCIKKKLACYIKFAEKNEGIEMCLYHIGLEFAITNENITNTLTLLY